MSTSRRKFLKLSAIAGGSVGLGLMAGPSNLASSIGESLTTFGRAPKPLKILILGGTGFTGPFQVKYALSRGHKVTVFNRGKTHPGELPKEAEQLVGDRNGQLDAHQPILEGSLLAVVKHARRGRLVEHPEDEHAGRRLDAADRRTGFDDRLDVPGDRLSVGRRIP